MPAFFLFCYEIDQLFDATRNEDAEKQKEDISDEREDDGGMVSDENPVGHSNETTSISVELECTRTTERDVLVDSPSLHKDVELLTPENPKKGNNLPARRGRSCSKNTPKSRYLPARKSTTK